VIDGQRYQAQCKLVAIAKASALAQVPDVGKADS